MATTYKYYIDFDGDQDFTDAGEDISAYVRSLSIQTGARRASDGVASPMICRLGLRNTDKRFSPESGSAVAGFHPGRAVRVTADVDRGDRDGTYSNITLGQTGIGDGRTAAGSGVAGIVNFYSAPLAAEWSNDRGTISVWAYFGNSFIGSEGVMSVDLTSGDTMTISRTAAGTVSFTATGYTSITTAITHSQWYHFVMVYDPARGDVRAFVDGVLVGTSEASKTFAGTLNTAAAGINMSGGRVAHASIWNATLDDSQIMGFTTHLTRQYDYTITTTPRRALIGYWPFDEASGTTATDYSGSLILFTGAIATEGVQPSVDTKGERITQVEAEGYFARLLDDRCKTTWLNNKLPNELIQGLIDGATVTPAGHDPSADRETYTVLFDGNITYPYAGDNWRAGAEERVYTAFQEIATAEQGFVYEGTDNTVRFFDRNYIYSAQARIGALTIPEADILRSRRAAYAYGEDIVNEARVVVYPREIGTTKEIVGRLRSSPLLPVGQTGTFTIKYSDTASNVVAMGSQGATMTKNTDWKANLQSNGAGTDVSAHVTLTVTNRATYAEVAARGDGSAPPSVTGYYIVPGTRDPDNVTVWGTGVRQYDSIEYIAEDTTSQSTYGYRPRVIDSRIQGDSSYAYELASKIIQDYKDPRGVMRSITVKPTRDTDYILMSIGDLVSLAETQTGHSGTYQVVGIAHSAPSAPIARTHEITYTLAPTPAGSAWLLGVSGFSELGETTVLGL